MSDVDTARELLQLANSDPAEAIARSGAFIAQHHDVIPVAIAHRAQALGKVKIGDLPGALEDLGVAVSLLSDAGDDHVLGEVLMTRAGVESFAGEIDASIRSISRAIEMLDGLAVARARVQRSAIYYRTGALDAARRDLAEAEPVLRNHDDAEWLGHMASNLGIVLALQGDGAGAERALLDAHERFTALGHISQASEALQNLGWALSIAGDIPRALHHLAEAEREFREEGHRLSELWGDRCDALIAAHLGREAQELALEVARDLRSTGVGAGYPEALVRLARAARLNDDHETSLKASLAAARVFGEQGRHAWVAQAELQAARARLALGELTAEYLDEVERLVRSLAQSGLLHESRLARLLFADLAVRVGELELAERAVAEVDPDRHRDSLDVVVAAWRVRALIRLGRGDRRGADAAARAGLRVVDEYQAVLGASEMRVSVAAHAAELGDIGLRLALDRADPERVFAWMERTRAGALRFAPVTPPEDAALAAELTELRRLEDAARRDPAESTSDVQARQRELQDSVRNRSRLAVGDASGDSVSRVLNLAAVHPRLGEATLVELATSDGSLRAVVVDASGASQHDLGELRPVTTSLDSVRLAVSRLAQRRGSAESLSSFAQIAEASLTELDTLLLGALAMASTGPIVVVPPPMLHAVPWGLLPSLRSRSVTVAPSAGLWLDRIGRRRSIEQVLIANGPDLPAASEEARKIAGLYESVARLTARSASVDRVLEALEDADAAHLIAHGNFRSDNPLFSSLRFADGGLTVYDMERLQRVPPLIVLSACNAGLQAPRPGNETMGIVAALLGAGARNVIASTGLVPDTGRTAGTMVQFHRLLQEGLLPAAALATAQAEALARGGNGYLAAPFVCFGAG